MEVFELFRSRIQNRRDVLNYVSIRLAEARDDERLGGFLLKVFGVAATVNTPDEPLRTGRISEILNVAGRRRDGQVVIAELGSEVIGSFSLIPPQRPLSGAWSGDAGYFCAFAVDPKFQGIGLAPALMEEAQLLACRANMARVHLKVVRASKKLYEFYERFGYQRDERGDSIDHGVELVGFDWPVSALDLHDRVRREA
jgi:GNAT superfamily N-acetyltransferase